MSITANCETDSLNRLIKLFHDCQQAALERNLEQTSLEGQAYHLGRKVAYEEAKISVEREKKASSQSSSKKGTSDMMTLEEMKFAVCGKLPELVELCEGPSRKHPCWKVSNGNPINWPTEGLRVCHEAEKLLRPVCSGMPEYEIALVEIVKRDATASLLDNFHFALAHATCEQRLEALCRVWWPERFK